MQHTAVIGTVFVDIKGFPFQTYSAEGRNVGDVKIVHGGVCRNVAEDLANIGCPVSFVTMFERGGIGAEVRDRLSTRGVDLQYAVEADVGMGMWLAVMNERGDLAGSISRQPDFSALEAQIDARGDEILRACDAVVLEVDMRASIAEKVLDLAERHGRDVYVVVGNMSVILQKPELLSRVKLFIMNEIEASRLFGCEVKKDDPAGAQMILQREALRRGMRETVVTLGEAGAVYFDAQQGDCGHVPAEKTCMVDSTGAGDAFFSGTVAARIRGLPLRRAAELGAHLAALTIRTEESTCPQITGFIEEDCP